MFIYHYCLLRAVAKQICCVYYRECWRHRFISFCFAKKFLQALITILRAERLWWEFDLYQQQHYKGVLKMAVLKIMGNSKENIIVGVRKKFRTPVIMFSQGFQRFFLHSWGKSWKSYSCSINFVIMLQWISALLYFSRTFFYILKARKWYLAKR